MAHLPTGTVTFLFSDLEGSTRLWEQHPETMQAVLARHDALLKEATERNDGYLVKTTGDGVHAAFATASDALNAALSAQLALLAEPWPDSLAIKVRIGIHTGAAEVREGDYYGTAVNRAARIMAAGYGGQVVLSGVTAELCHDALPDNVSLLPLGEHRLKDLARPETIFQVNHPALPSVFPPLKTLDSFPNNLPRQLTSFVGREKEIEQVRELLTTTRLLTLTGAGGSGKTRLSLQVAADLLQEYPDGVWFVELAPLSDPLLVPQAVAQALGVKEQAGKTIQQTLLEHLRTKKMLILLDNCEHLVDACAKLADAILKNCPNVTLLATSREALNLAGELTYRIPSLSLPDTKQPQTVESLSQYEAVRLFIERALFHQPAFQVTNENAPALAQLCVQLDGIPLAIELAAARIRSLSVEEINAKLVNRFRLLTGGSRSVLPRQQTLRALIDWSYDLLNAQEKALLCRLSVFAGGWLLEAAEAVGVSERGEGMIEEWEVLDLLTSLADKSLVVVETGAVTRYRLLESMRQYAAEKLRESGEANAARNRHLAFYLALAEEAYPLSFGPEAPQSLNRLAAEHDNLRAALASAAEAERGAEAGLRLASALTMYWFPRGHLNEGRAMLKQALAKAGDSATSSYYADTLHGIGYLALLQGDYAEAKEFIEKSLAIHQKLGNSVSVISIACLSGLGHLAAIRGDHAASKAYFEEALSNAREIGDRGLEANMLCNLGRVAERAGDYVASKAYGEDALRISRAVGNIGVVGLSLVLLAKVALDQGDYVVSAALCCECLRVNQSLGDRRSFNISLTTAAILAAKQGRAERAARLFGASEALRETTGLADFPVQREQYDREVEAARQAADAEAFDAAWAEGRAMTLEQAIEYALGQDRDQEP